MLPIDAIPDLSGVQVIIRTEFAEQAPQVVEGQVTLLSGNGILR
jgi:Cu(I)/Ag(I) efflux system membrane protein CusA/SilA